MYRLDISTVHKQTKCWQVQFRLNYAQTVRGPTAKPCYERVRLAGRASPFENDFFEVKLWTNRKLSSRTLAFKF